MKIDRKYFEGLDNSALNLELRKACHYAEMELAKFIVLDMNVMIDKITLDFLNGKNLDFTVHDDILEIVKVRDSHQKLESSLTKNNSKNTLKI